MTTVSASAAPGRGALVAAAVNDHRISLDSVPRWLAAFVRDPEGTGKVLASLSPGLPPAPAPRPPFNGNPVDRALDTGTPPPLRTPDRPTRTIELGGGLVRMEAQLIAGKPRSEWTEQESRDWLMWQLGPRFRRGLKPPPEPSWHIPTDSITHTTDAAWGLQ